MYEPKYLGEWTVSNTVYEQLSRHPFLQCHKERQDRWMSRQASEERPKRVCSQPPSKVAKGQDGAASKAGVNQSPSSSLSSSYQTANSAEWEQPGMRDADASRPAPPPPRGRPQFLNSIQPVSSDGPPPETRRSSSCGNIGFSSSRCGVTGCNGILPYGSYWCTNCAPYKPW